MPKVTVILTHQLECNRKYLELALLGLREQSFQDFSVYLMNGSGSPDPSVLDQPPGSMAHWDPALDTATKKINWAIGDSDSEFILLHSDDVVLSRGCLGEMVSSSLFPCIMNPFSNSDCRSLYHADPELRSGETTKRVVHDMSYEDLVGWETAILDFPVGQRILMQVPTVSFYCTLIPRAVWTRVGALDPELEYRHNDQDFCFRARGLGIPSVVNLAPFAFHFGTKTLNHLADEAEKTRASVHFAKKWNL